MEKKQKFVPLFVGNEVQDFQISALRFSYRVALLADFALLVLLQSLIVD